MNVIVYGATGRVGSRVLNELVSRGHSVVGGSRDPSAIPSSGLVTTVADDLSNVAHTATVVHGADAVVSALGPPHNDPSQLVSITENLIQAIAHNKGPRLIVVGGTATLYVEPGLTLFESRQIPPAALPIAHAHVEVLEHLRRSHIDWTNFSPAGYFAPGRRTGHFRLGKENLIADSSGMSAISMEDYAIALVDELEQPHHAGGQHFTIGY